jgi:DNA invertase Pin-like site-specific DNA recombinase
MAREHNGGFVAYYRVSTAQQGRSGLGLEAQVTAVKSYLNGGDWHLVDEFTEVESRKRRVRPELEKALAMARLYRVPLVVAKVDRLTRSAAFLQRLLDADVEILFCDLPKIEGPTGRFLLRQIASVAELEADMISARTKLALAAFKVRERKKPKVERRRLGGERRTTLTDEARALGRGVIAERARQYAANVGPTIAELQAAGATTLLGIADGLNRSGIPTPRGWGQWRPVQVWRVLARMRGPKKSPAQRGA